MVLEDVTELYVQYDCTHGGHADALSSDYTGGQTKLSKILLNGNNICMVCLIYLWGTIADLLIVNTWWRGPWYRSFVMMDKWVKQRCLLKAWEKGN